MDKGDWDLDLCGGEEEAAAETTERVEEEEGMKGGEGD